MKSDLHHLDLGPVRQPVEPAARQAMRRWSTIPRLDDWAAGEGSPLISTS